MVSYWEKRRAQMMYEEMAIAEKAASSLGKEYLKTAKYINKLIKECYGHIKNNYKITDNEVLSIMKSANIDSYNKLIEVVKRKDFPQELIDYLSSPNQRIKFERMLQQKSNIDAAITRLSNIQNTTTADTIKEVAKDSYYRSIFEVQKHTGIGFSFNEWDEELFSKLARKKWSGENYSTRIWNNRDKLAEIIKGEIMQGFIAGKTQDEMYDVIINEFAVSNSNARRLIRTESCYASNEMEMQSYSECDIEKYIFVATLDLRTSDICASLDGKVFDVKDAMPGKNMPPMHPWCRSTTIEYVDDETLKSMKRRARDPVTGKNITVPANMTYAEWHKKFVEGNEDAIINRKMIKNDSIDNKQYTKYLERLGKDYAGKNVEEFKKIKYTNPEKYAIMKAQYKGIGYYNKAVAAEPEITKMVMDVAKSSDMGLAGLEYRIKTKESYLEKIAREYAPGYNYEVKDTLRYTMMTTPNDYVQNIKNANNIFKNNHCVITKCRNYWLDNKNPYNGVNILIQDSKGNKFEVQYHTKESFEIKQQTHELYEKQRVLEEDSREYLSLKKQMYEINSKIKIPKDIQEVK